MGDPEHRHVARADLSAEFDALHSPFGRSSTLPKRLLRALLLHAFHSIRSKCHLMDRIEFDLLFRWFPGPGVDGPVWDATTFTKNRERLLAGEMVVRFLAIMLARPKIRALLSTEHVSVLRSAAQHVRGNPATRSAAAHCRSPSADRSSELGRTSCVHTHPRTGFLKANSEISFASWSNLGASPRRPILLTNLESSSGAQVKFRRIFAHLLSESLSRPGLHPRTVDASHVEVVEYKLASALARPLDRIGQRGPANEWRNRWFAEA